MKLAFGADHTGVALKAHLMEFARSLGHEPEDLGTQGDERVDYPDFGEAVALAVLEGRADLGIVLCSNGVGISIAANKVRGIRCALCHTSWSARRAREHVDANVLALGALEVGPAIAEEILLAFVESSFQGGRHERRVGKLRDLERRSAGAEAVRA